MCSEMDWWAVPLTAFVAFTLYAIFLPHYLWPNIANNNRYGIEGIAATYEDPFGVAKIDINMDDIVEDARREVEVLLTAWQTQGTSNGGIFRPRVGEMPKSDNSSLYYSDLMDQNEPNSASRNQVRFVVNDLSESGFRDDESERLRAMRMASVVSPGATENSEYFSAWIMVEFRMYLVRLDDIEPLSRHLNKYIEVGPIMCYRVSR